MVHGLDIFREYFKDYTEQYVLIGGTAASIIMEEFGNQFRATKDLDIVLIVEMVNKEFGEKFWEFIKAGDYQNKNNSAGEEQFYRFSEPKNSEYPFMIELFSKKPAFLKSEEEGRFTPIHIDSSVTSLSAILLNDEYYELLRRGRKKENGLSILNIETLILFKMKAWLDMQERKENGERVDSKNINKHRNDIFRLIVNIVPKKTEELESTIIKDVKKFIEKIKLEKINLSDLGIKRIKIEEIFELMEEIYLNYE